RARDLAAGARGPGRTTQGHSARGRCPAAHELAGHANGTRDGGVGVMLYLLLYPLHTQFSIFNVFRYLRFRLIYATLTAFVLVIVLAPPVIRALQSYGVGQRIREVGLRRHQVK